jgi:hypothetical protein
MVDPSLSVAELRSMWEQGRIRLTDIPEYKTWYHLIQRCHNPEHPYYHHYGGRGIYVHEPWRKRFEGFWLFFQHVNRRPAHVYFYRSEFSIDRINNDLGYFPGNLRWADAYDQANNRRPEFFKGEGNPRAILKLEQVQFIRDNCEIYTNAELAELTESTVFAVGDVIRNRNWYDPNWSKPERQWHSGFGETHVHASITNIQAGWIKYLIAEGFPPSVIAGRLDVSLGVVQGIQGGNWSHIEPSCVGLPPWPKNFKRRM